MKLGAVTQEEFEISIDITGVKTKEEARKLRRYIEEKVKEPNKQRLLDKLAEKERELR